MPSSKRTLVVILCMHRSGSSFSANLLKKMGLNLGPYHLVGATSANRRGHFESLPINQLGGEVQQWAHGFSADMPQDPETLARFVESGGAWPSDRAVPTGFLRQGRKIIGDFMECGPLTGFKEPRGVLIWPFWREVLRSFDNVEVKPLVLVRTPHEIAMSMCDRANGLLPYWGALDTIAIHFTKMKEIADEFSERPVVARFGAPRYWNDMRRVVERIGLSWREELIADIYDQASVHQIPATVSHPAQNLFDEFCGDEPSAVDSEVNLTRLFEDARRLESLMFARLSEKTSRRGAVEPALATASAPLRKIAEWVKQQARPRLRRLWGWPLESARRQERDDAR